MFDKLYIYKCMYLNKLFYFNDDCKISFVNFFITTVIFILKYCFRGNISLYYIHNYISDLVIIITKG